MADKKVSNERKRELEQLDPFQENILKAVKYAKEYKKQLILICGAVVLVVVVFAGIMVSFQKAESTAATLVNQALRTYADANDPVKGYLAVEKDFQAIFKDFANTTSGRQAKVKFAKICYDASKFDQSYQFYKESYDLFKHEALMENFLLASLGDVCLARKEFEEAKKYFLQIENGKTDLLKDEARYALAMLYEADNNKAESIKMYDKITAENVGSMYNQIAKSKLDELNEKN